jgi:hypothetical protein
MSSQHLESIRSVLRWLNVCGKADVRFYASIRVQLISSPLRPISRRLELRAAPVAASAIHNERVYDVRELLRTLTMRLKWKSRCP